MKEALLAAVVCSVVAYMGHYIGYNRAQSYYVARIEQTDRAIRGALQGASQTLSELSALTGVSDQRDLDILQEIMNAAPTSGDTCRIGIDRLRSLDAISP
jgi:hypothetical protein